MINQSFKTSKMVSFFSSIVLICGASYGMGLQSKDLRPGGKISDDFVYQGMDCTGRNISPELHWSMAPKETKSFALTVYDPDAPTGSGWWHWIAYDIPASTTSLKKGWKSADLSGVVEATNDFGAAKYDGPCPPPGKPHHYIFTIHALKVEKLGAPAGASNAYVRYMIEGATIKKASFTALYGR